MATLCSGTLSTCSSGRPNANNTWPFLIRSNCTNAKVEFDADAEVFHGDVINTRDMITFQCESVEELKTAFHDSVDDYLTWCEERGEQPEKPFSGQFMARVSPDLQRRALALEASRRHTSLNKLVEAKLAQDPESESPRTA